MSPELSVIVPMYNEEAVIPLFVERLRPVLEALEHDGISTTYEVICVDDGSKDRTAELLLEARSDWPQLRVVRLLRNAGHQAALTAGMECARGQLAVTIDADLQDPPEAITQMYDLAIDQSLDVVYAIRADRSSDGLLKRRTAHLYYRLMRRLSGPQLPDNAGDFRLISRRVLDALSYLPEHGRVYRLVIPWFGFPSGRVEFVRERRAAGRTKYSLGRMASLGLDSVTAFSAAPLRVATLLGSVGPSSLCPDRLGGHWSLHGGDGARLDVARRRGWLVRRRSTSLSRPARGVRRPLVCRQSGAPDVPHWL